jgi:hypothetical protein
MSGYSDSVFGYPDPVFRYSDPVVGYPDPVFEYPDPVFGYSEPAVGYLIGPAGNSFFATASGDRLNFGNVLDRVHRFLSTQVTVWPDSNAVLKSSAMLKSASWVRTIDKNLVLGANLSVETYTQEIAATREILDDYNRALATVDVLHLKLKAAERKLAHYSEKMLLGVAHTFGKESLEYATAGGTRKAIKLNEETTGSTTLPETLSTAAPAASTATDSPQSEYPETPGVQSCPPATVARTDSPPPAVADRPSVPSLAD